MPTWQLNTMSEFPEAGHNWDTKGRHNNWESEIQDQQDSLPLLISGTTEEDN